MPLNVLPHSFVPPATPTPAASPLAPSDEGGSIHVDRRIAGTKPLILPSALNNERKSLDGLPRQILDSALDVMQGKAPEVKDSAFAHDAGGTFSFIFGSAKLMHSVTFTRNPERPEELCHIGVRNKRTEREIVKIGDDNVRTAGSDSEDGSSISSRSPMRGPGASAVEMQLRQSIRSGSSLDERSSQEPSGAGTPIHGVASRADEEFAHDALHPWEELYGVLESPMHDTHQVGLSAAFPAEMQTHSALEFGSAMESALREIDTIDNAVQRLAAEDIKSIRSQMDAGKPHIATLIAAFNYFKIAHPLHLLEIARNAGQDSQEHQDSAGEEGLSEKDMAEIARYAAMPVDERISLGKDLEGKYPQVKATLDKTLEEYGFALLPYEQNSVTLKSETLKYRELYSRLVSLQTIKTQHEGEPLIGTAMEQASLPQNAPEHIKALARYIYLTERYYQGTATLEAEDRRANGMDPQNKVGSSVHKAIEEGYFKSRPPNELARFKNTALSHFYFTKLKRSPPGTTTMSATGYARLASRPDNPPKVLRAFLPKGSVPLGDDPDSSPGNLAWRTSEKVPPGYILRPKNAPVAITEASEAFKREFNEDEKKRALLGIDQILDSEEAARMLREEQTDSDTDFPESPRQ